MTSVLPRKSILRSARLRESALDGPLMSMDEMAAEYQSVERAAARNLADYATALQSLVPGCDAVECVGGTAAFMGTRSPLTVVKGVEREMLESDIALAEAFFQGCGAACITFELAPWIAASSAQRLVERGYEEVGAESVVIRDVPTDPASNPFSTSVLDAEAWGDVFREVAEIPPFEWWTALSRAAGLLPGGVNLAVRGADGWIACAQLAPAAGFAILCNDNTIEAARGRGIQKTLIRERLHRAAGLGLRRAIAEVEPGSVSEANYIKCGFRVAYVRAHYSRELT